MKREFSLRPVLIPLTLAIAGTTSVFAQTPPPARSHDHTAGLVTMKGPSPNATRLNLEVTGLTLDDAEALRSALGTETKTEYTCPRCGLHEEAAGKCPSCGDALVSSKETLFASVTPLATSHEIAVTLPAGHVTRLSEIRKALAAHSVALRDDHLLLVGNPEILVSGGKAEQAGTLESALEEAGLYDRVKVRWDASAHDLVIEGQRDVTPPTAATIEDVLRPLELHVDDVVWGRTSQHA